ncbi:YggT family protein [Candidatus Saccharibacteria bacterium]|nr:YggT family protein [Candidatus Saccharibacteria bacterium]HPG37464.1 YggT family protein [Candidatus Saccharibacteria bacterium]
MPEQVRQTRQVTDADGNVATERISTVNETVRDDVPTTVDRPSNIVARTVWLIAGIIIGLLALRFVLLLLGASTASPFVNFIYNISYPFAWPFFGMFNYKVEYGVSKVEISTLVAMAVYALIAGVIARLATIRQPEA